MEEQKGYAWVIEEHKLHEDDEDDRTVHMPDSDKVVGCCAHIKAVAGAHRYTLMHLCAMAGVRVFNSFTAATLRHNWKRLPPEEFEKLCRIVQFSETLYGDQLPHEETDRIINEYVEEWLLS